MDSQNQDIGTLLRTVRKQRGMSQQELARRLSVTHDAISDLEQGLRVMKVPELLELAQILEVSPTYFLVEQNPKKQSILFERCVEKLRDYPEGLLEVTSVLLDQVGLLKGWAENIQSEAERIELSLDSSRADKSPDIRVSGNLVFEAKREGPRK